MKTQRGELPGDALPAVGDDAIALLLNDHPAEALLGRLTTELRAFTFSPSAQ